MFNYIHYVVWNEITYRFPNFHGCTVQIWERIGNFIPCFNPCWWNGSLACNWICGFLWHTVTTIVRLGLPPNGTLVCKHTRGTVFHGPFSTFCMHTFWGYISPSLQIANLLHWICTQLINVAFCPVGLLFSQLWSNCYIIFLEYIIILVKWRKSSMKHILVF